MAPTRYITTIREVTAQGQEFNNCEFVFEGFKSNSKAHNLANFSVSFDRGRHVWLGSPHDPISIPTKRIFHQ